MISANRNPDKNPSPLSENDIATLRRAEAKAKARLGMTESVSIIEQIDTLTPSDRLVLIELRIANPAFQVEGSPIITSAAYPVLALEVAMVETWSRVVRPDSPGKPRTSKEAKSEGWSFQTRFPTRSFVYLDAEGKARSQYDRDPEVALQHVVACTWPAELDESRLADIIEDLKRRAA